MEGWPHYKNKAPPGIEVRMVLENLKQRSGLLRDWLLAEVIVISHAPVDDSVLLPLHRAFGVFALRIGYLLEHRVVGRPPCQDLIEYFELLLQHRGRSLEELHLVLGLQLDVI